PTLEDAVEEVPPLAVLHAGTLTLPDAGQDALADLAADQAVPGQFRQDGPAVAVGPGAAGVHRGHLAGHQAVVLALARVAHPDDAGVDRVQQDTLDGPGVPGAVLAGVVGGLRCGHLLPVQVLGQAAVTPGAGGELLPQPQGRLPLQLPGRVGVVLGD